MRWRLLVRDQALMTALAASAAYRRLPVVVPVLRAGEGHRGLCPRDEHERVYEPVSRRRMSTKISRHCDRVTPLQIIRSGISVFAIRAEWAYIAWAVMHEPMSNHLILALESFTTFAAWAFFHRTVMRSTLRMHIPMRTARHQPTCSHSKSYAPTSIDIASGRAAPCSRDSHI